MSATRKSPKLDAYRQKRDFARTPEPGESGGGGGGELRFVVQKHDATRLHYDFRLELDGVMKSWAVPKGPSLDPADKRLAVETEDHPLSYASFEDVIPAGEYGGGPVLVWDQGIWIPDKDPRQAYADGHLEFRLEGEKLTGSWRLIRTRPQGGKPSWLLMKRNDDAVIRDSALPIVDVQPRSVLTGRTIEEVEAGAPPATSPFDPERVPGARRGPLPDRVAPQLATLTEAPPTGAWLAEVKLDGYRLLAHRSGARLTLCTRSGLDWTACFPPVARAVARLPVEQVVLDGEVVILDKQGRADFGALQQAMSRPDAPFVCFAFDLLSLDGWDLRDAPLEARKRLLRDLLAAAPSPSLRYAEHIEGRVADFFREACQLGLEGVMCKRADAPYRSGRTRTWLKLKCTKRQELVIVGYTDPAGSRQGFGALLLGVRDEQGLRYAGRVGTGFSDRVLRDLHGRLQGMAVDVPPVRDPPRTRGLRWVAPDLVAEVGFTEWTRDGQVRHATFQGLREDKPADEVVRERPLEVPDAPNAPARPVRTGKTGPVRVAGVRLTNPDRVLFPDAGITKLELALAYEALAPRILPGLRDRPLTLFRCPEGVGGECFFQKHDRTGVPQEVRRIRLEDDPEPYLMVDDLPGLIGLVQIGALELHVQGVRTADLRRPDLLVMDLDPGPDVSWGRVAATALALRERLDALGLAPFLRLTGGKGLHVVAPLQPTADQDEVRGFAQDLATTFSRRDPDLYTSKLAKNRREGRILIDWVRNTRGATAVATWSTRARPGAPVAAPLSWSELDPGGAGPPVIDLRDALGRPDPWADIEAAARPLTAAMREAVGPTRR